jgi:hypothetical protein
VAGIFRGDPDRKTFWLRTLKVCSLFFGPQLYQIIDLKADALRYRAFKATGERYDEFMLRKGAGQANLLVEVFPGAAE